MNAVKNQIYHALITYHLIILVHLETVNNKPFYKI